MGRRSPLPPRFTNADQIYATVQPDAVCIVTPHMLHDEQEVQTLDAGCHILMKKPIVTNAEHEQADQRDPTAWQNKRVAYETILIPMQTTVMTMSINKQAGYRATPRIWRDET